ncbi:MAG: MFS transporter [Bacteroidales bacterium]|nr:MFS transporter [Bacteroidales bacterium]
MGIRGLELNKHERRTFWIHMMYSLIEGVIVGALALNEFVLIKSLKGSDYQIGFLAQFSVLVLLFSVVFNEFIKRIHDKRKMLRIMALVTRLPLLAFLFFPSDFMEYQNNTIFPYFFLGIFLIYFLAQPVILPVINLFLKNSYRHQNFGKLYSYTSSASKIIMMGSTFIFGVLLDLDQTAFRFVYPVMGGLGIMSIFIFSNISYNEEINEVKIKSYWDAIQSSVRNMWAIIRKNKPYRDFEIGFMLYGFAWLSTIAVIAIFFNKVLDLNYSSVAFYKNAYNIIAIVSLPYFGRLLGKIDPRKFAVITFSALMLYLFFMGLTEFFPAHFELFGLKIYYTLILAYLFYSVFAATMALLWFIGSAYFCEDRQAAEYQSVHLTLTGLRGAFATLIGIYFYQLIGFAGTFAIAVISCLIAVVLMIYSYKKYK